MHPVKVRNWTPPRNYKNTSKAQEDFRLALKKVAEGIAMLDGIAVALNNTNIGNGDIIHGVSASLRGTLTEVQAVSSDVQSIISGDEVKTHRARKYIRLARSKTSDRKVRREIRQRQRKQERSASKKAARRNNT